MDVKIKDRKDEIEFIRMALNIVGIGVDYANADLINRTIKELNKLKGQFSLKDGVKLLYDWKDDWRKYAEKQEETVVTAEREPR